MTDYRYLKTNRTSPKGGDGSGGVNGERKGKSETTGIVSPLIEAINGLPGCWATRLQSGLAKGWKGGRLKVSMSGTPDLFALVKGTPLFIEAKDPKGKTDPKRAELQAKIQERLRVCGALVHVVTSYHEGMAVVRDVIEFERQRGRFVR